MKPEDKAKVQQALDALEWFKEHGLSVSEIKLAENSITALRQLLERTEQEPAFYWDRGCFFVRPERAKSLNLDVDAMQALYATPPAQPAAWVGLTDEDLDALACGGLWPDRKLIARSVEAKLREKNGGA